MTMTHALATRTYKDGTTIGHCTCGSWSMELPKGAPIQRCIDQHDIHCRARRAPVSVLLLPEDVS